jgi:nucleoside-diphosphate-sugar epimerase
VRILVAGATGAVGTHLVPALLRRGYEVVGTTRTPAKTGTLESIGARAAVLDSLDGDAVMTAARDLRPTSSSSLWCSRRRAELRGMAVRTAGRAGQVRRGSARSESARPLRSTLEAIRTLESAVLEAHGTVLRYGAFYGPGTSLMRGGAQMELIRQRQFPIVGRGTGLWSFAHIADIADATAHAIAQGATGIYNIADDERAQVAEWLPHLAPGVRLALEEAEPHPNHQSQLTNHT